MSNNKLSLHIGEKNLIAFRSGFNDVALSSGLSLNKETVASIRGAGSGGPTEVAFTWTFTLICIPDTTLGMSPVLCGSFYDCDSLRCPRWA